MHTGGQCRVQDCSRNATFWATAKFHWAATQEAQNSWLGLLCSRLRRSSNLGIVEEEVAKGLVEGAETWENLSIVGDASYARQLDPLPPWMLSFLDLHLAWPVDLALSCCRQRGMVICVFMEERPRTPGYCAVVGCMWYGGWQLQIDTFPDLYICNYDVCPPPFQQVPLLVLPTTLSSCGLQAYVSHWSWGFRVVVFLGTNYIWWYVHPVWCV